MSSRKIKILYIANTEKIIGGAERSLLSILRHIKDRNVIPYFASIYDSELNAEVAKLGVLSIKLSPFSKYNSPRFVLECLRLARKLNDLQIDAIHTNRLHDAFYGILPARLAGIPIIAHHRDCLYTSIDNFLWKLVDRNICNSNWQNQTFVKGRGEVIHNGIELDLFTPGKNRADVRTSFSLDESQILIGVVGRITPIKGQQVFLDAAEEIIRRRTDCYFLIQGDASTKQDEDYQASLFSRIHQNKDLKDRFILRKGIHEVSSVLAALDVSVVPSTRESFGRMVIESMAMKKPVVSTYCGGPAEIVTPETGLLVPSNDPVALANAIVVLADSPKLRTKMGNAGRERVEELFTVDKMINKIANLYSSFIK